MRFIFDAMPRGYMATGGEVGGLRERGERSCRTSRAQGHVIAGTLMPSSRFGMAMANGGDVAALVGVAAGPFAIRKGLGPAEPARARGSFF